MQLAVKKSGGFSLIELMVLLTIFGIVMATGAVKYAHDAKVKALNDTLMRRDIVSAAFSRYLFNFGALPCPASPSLPPGSPKAGVGDCTTVMAKFSSYTQWQPNESCDANNICVAQGARFTANNPSYCPGPPACKGRPPGSARYNDPVIIGTLPYVDLGIAVNDSVDGWGNRMTYAVSYYLTTGWVKPGFQCGSPRTPHAFCSDLGVIAVKNYHASTDTLRSAPNPNLSIGLPGVPDSYRLAIVSHGATGKGAWSYSGVQTKPCDMTPIDAGAGSGLSRQPASSGRDNENCNGDAVFLANGTVPDQNLVSHASGFNFYDDAFVLTDTAIGKDMWKLGQQENRLEKMDGGFVGINTFSPAVPLDVQGNIQAANIQSDTYCDNSTGNCFKQRLLSPGLTCNGGLMTGIAGSAPLCQTSISPSGIVPATCPPGQYVSGLDKDGRPTCGAP